MSPNTPTLHRSVADVHDLLFCSRLAGSAFHRLLCARMKRLSRTILAVFLALPVLAQGAGAFFGGATTQARLLLSAESAKPGGDGFGRSGTENGPRLAYLLAQRRRRGPPHHGDMDASARRQRGRNPMADPRKDGDARRRQPALHLRLRGPGGVAGSHQTGGGFAPRPGAVERGGGVDGMQGYLQSLHGEGERELDRGRRGQTFGQLWPWSNIGACRLPQPNAERRSRRSRRDGQSAAPGSPRAVIIDWHNRRARRPISIRTRTRGPMCKGRRLFCRGSRAMCASAKW